MNKEIIFNDLGLIDYQDAWDFQESLFQETITQKGHPDKPQTSNFLLFCEHPHVYTLGKSGSENNLLINNQALAEKGVSFFRTNRGGDITYHGPGQIVGYPILDLENFKLGIRKYIWLLEESIIALLRDFGISASRLDGASGVWLDADQPGKVRKICAIGVRSSRYVTMHGFAFNINTKLEYYNYINPCGFTERGVTSLEKELGSKQDIEKVKIQLKAHLLRLLKNH
ncbi:MAG: lipoyl(octanoyl) transferase LipB [Bacteroidales bacterium]|nr:lipoyl(octanoyl) transferase LipB [Bacteroidales bacterium]